MEMKKVADLTPHELNPRSITEGGLNRLGRTMDKFGDISGIVFNRTTRKQITGHQRCKILTEGEVVLKEILKKSDHQGTIALGHVVMPDGTKWAYREVIWDAATEHAAMICANTNAGEWVDALLRDNLTLVAEGGGDVEDTGLSGEFTEALFRGAGDDTSTQALEKKGLTKPLNAADMKLLPSQTQMVQLFMTVATRPAFLEVIGKLKLKLGTPDMTTTVEKAVFAFALDLGIKPSTPVAPALVPESEPQAEDPFAAGQLEEDPLANV